jgi:hypothetical protein
VFLLDRAAATILRVREVLSLNIRATSSTLALFAAATIRRLRSAISAREARAR